MSWMSHLRIRDHISSFLIHTKPEKKTFVMKDMPKHSLFLFPHSAHTAYKTKGGKKEFQVGVDWIDSKETVGGEILWIKPHFQPKVATKASDAALTETFWTVRRVNRAEAGDTEGNMRLEYLNSRGHVVTCHTSDSMKESEVKFLAPCLTNIKDIQDGDELIWVADFRSKKRKDAEPLKKAEAKKAKNTAEESSEK
jgi:hypothetical protein